MTTKQRIMDIRQRNPSLSVKVLAKAFNLSTRTIIRYTKNWRPYAHEDL